MKRPEPTSRHPLVIFLMILCVFTSLRVLLGAPAPASVESELHSWQVTLWGVGLGLGSAAFLAGVYLQPRDGAPHVVTGIVLEQFGCAALFATCLVYSMCIIAATGINSIFLAGIVFVLALACGFRWRTIQRHVKAIGDDQGAQDAAGLR